MNTYQAQAQAVKARRSYPSVAQLAAGRKLINQGTTVLSKEELTLLSEHPYMSVSQKIEFARLAATL